MDGFRAASMAIEADVLSAQRGDQQAFTRLVETTCSLVSSIALAIVRDPDLSRDIAQDVFLSVWRDIGKLREPASFLPWLRQVTRHRAFHILRGLRRRTRHAAEGDADELLEAAVDPRPDPLQRLTSLETRRLVNQTIERLPVDAREVVTLYYREGRSVSQVGDLLGLSDAAVRQRLSRARACLRDDLLELAGQELAASAPGAAFVAGVAVALTVAAPAVSSAATIAAAGAKGIGPFGKIAVFFGGATLGAAGSALGVVLGVRHLERTAYDDEERRGLTQLKRVSVLTTFAGAFGLAAALRLTQSPAPAIVAFGAFILSLVAIHEIWLPRILRRRYEAEMRADPARALRARRRERIQKAVGWTLGLLAGGAALLLSLSA